MSEIAPRHPWLFNTPLETGIRALSILLETHPGSCDLQRLLLYDYLLVHSHDANGPESLHPPTPHRSGEVLVRRRLVERGLLLMMSRGLLAKDFADDGVKYRVVDSAPGFLACLTSDYARDLQDRAEWVVATFGQTSDSELDLFFRQNLDRWGGEFVLESLFHEGVS